MQKMSTARRHKRFTEGASIMMYCYSNVKKTTNGETKYRGVAKTK